MGWAALANFIKSLKTDDFRKLLQELEERFTYQEQHSPWLPGVREKLLMCLKLPAEKLILTVGISNLENLKLWTVKVVFSSQFSILQHVDE